MECPCKIHILIYLPLSRFGGWFSVPGCLSLPSCSILILRRIDRRCADHSCARGPLSTNTTEKSD